MDANEKLGLRTARRSADRADALADRESKIKLKRLKAQDRAERNDRRFKAAAAGLVKVGRTVLITGPILTPMAMAWTGQAAFAMTTLGWAFLGGLFYAAAYELTAAFCAWMHHEARRDGDKGWEYRVATWAFAIGSAVQQWWHYSDQWQATPRSVTFATMTIVGLLVWELYGRLIHRRSQRKAGRIDGVRPRFGLVRWVRFPVRTWTAWSISVLNNVGTVDEAWSAAEQHITNRKAIESTDRPGPPAGPRRTSGRTSLATKPRPTDQTPAPTDQTPTSEGVTLDRVAPTPDLVRTPTDRTPTSAPKALGPAPTSGGEDGFIASEDEAAAVKALLAAGRNLNRENVAHQLRNVQHVPTSTQRASQVAKWGRDNSAAFNLRAV